MYEHKPWPRLQPGDAVRVVSPASTPTEDQLADLTRGLEAWGLVVQHAPHVLDRWGYMAGRDADRLRDLDDAFADPEVRAVFASRGGAGAYRIAERVDLDAVRRDPKPLVGYSDITCLHLTLWGGTGLVNIHGALAGPASVASARRLLTTDEPVVAVRDPGAVSAQVQVEGRATGPLVGGNLTTLTHLAGGGLPSLAGTVLLIEDTRDQGLGRIDRQLTQLRRAGALDGVVGVALGLFSGFEGYEDRGWSLTEVLADHLVPLGVPVLGGLPIGHPGPDGLPDQTCAALGALAVLDTAAGTLTSRA